MRAVDMAWNGLGQAEARLERIAGRLGRLPVAIEPPAPRDSVDPSAEMVSLLEARNRFQTNARVLKTALELEERLLDTLG